MWGWGRMGGMKVAIVGFATEGRVSLEYFKNKGDDVTVCDRDKTVVVPDYVGTQLGDNYLRDLDRFDLIVRTAGLQPSTILSDKPNLKNKVTTAVNEFLANSPTKNTIGVTGTKGKGTTSTLIAKMLEAAGKKAWLGGNIGNSPLEFIDRVQPDDWVVLELSSFQLADLQVSPHIAICLMVVPEHLNWHIDLEDYMAAKRQLFIHQNQDDAAIYYSLNQASKTIAEASPGKLLPFFKRPGALIENNELRIDNISICRTDEIKMLGAHNWQNACAAVTAVWQAGIHDSRALRAVLTSFTGLPHRLELVREIDGVKYYNDSFAATPDAGSAGVAAISGKKIVIMGGFDRMLPLERFAESLQKQATEVEQVLLIGASAERVAAAFTAVGFHKYIVCKQSSMAGIVAAARSLVTPSTKNILLSPGFPSFDMFKNFEDRGDQFRAEVKGL